MHKTIYFLLISFSLSGCGLIQPTEKKLLSSRQDVRVKALRKLSQMSLEDQAKLVKPLTASLRDSDSRIVNRAMEALVIIGRPAVENVRTVLTDSDVYVRISGIATLGQMGPVAENSIPELITCLKDPHPLIREEAARSLGNMGQLAEPAGVALFDAQNDPEDNVKRSVSEALAKIGLTPPTNATKKPI